MITSLPLAVLLFGTSLAAEDMTGRYHDVAGRIIDAALADRDGYAKLTYLCDRIGNRLSGSEALNRAIQWAAAEMKKDGLQNVSTPAVQVPHWVRGHETAAIVEPF